MADRLVLHVGTMKSGTSYLQGLLFTEKARLAGHGVLVPGETWVDQARAVRQAVSPRVRGSRDRWDALVTEVRSTPGTAVLSMEYLGPCRPALASAIVTALGATEVSVVVTARDLNRTLVSMWQETVQNGRSWGWADYLAAAEARRPGDGVASVDQSTAGGTFWRQQDLARIVADWSEVVGHEAVTVVTVPPPDAPRHRLPERFVEATGLPIDPRTRVRAANESLGAASVLVLRRLNELLDEQGLAFPAGQRLRKRLLAKTVLAGRKAEEPAVGLATPAWVREQTVQTVGRVRATGVRLVGDWSDLDPVDVPGTDPQAVPLAEVHAAAMAGLAGLVGELVRS